MAPKVNKQFLKTKRDAKAAKADKDKKPVNEEIGTPGTPHDFALEFCMFYIIPIQFLFVFCWYVKSFIHY